MHVEEQQIRFQAGLQPEYTALFCVRFQLKGVDRAFYGTEA